MFKKAEISQTEEPDNGPKSSNQSPIQMTNSDSGMKSMQGTSEYIKTEDKRDYSLGEESMGTKKKADEKYDPLLALKDTQVELGSLIQNAVSGFENDLIDFSKKSCYAALDLIPKLYQQTQEAMIAFAEIYHNELTSAVKDEEIV
jgi:hypothetical protein